MIIDIHAHLWAQSHKRDKLRILKACDVFSINKVYISTLSTYYPSLDEVTELNNLTLGYMKEHPNKIGGFVHVDPRHKNKIDVLTKAIEYDGMEGVKLWVSVLCDDIRVNTVAEKCIEYKIPILLHAFHKATGQLEHESTALNVRELALRYPELKIIMAHMGGNVYHGLRCISDLNNVYADFSGTLVGQGDMEYALKCIGEDRLLFGTDMPMGGRQCIAQVEDACLTKIQKEKIYFRNAMKVLGEGR